MLILIAGPYRAALTKLQEAAPPLPARTVHGVLAERIGEDWREHFLEFEDTPAAAASIGSNCPPPNNRSRQQGPRHEASLFSSLPLRGKSADGRPASRDRT